MSPTTLYLPIFVIMFKYLCNILGRKGTRVTYSPSTSIRKRIDLDPSILTGNSGSLRHCKTIQMSMCRLFKFNYYHDFFEAMKHPGRAAS